MHEICVEHNLDVFNFIPLTFIFDTDSPGFKTDILHFFRFFKGLQYYNFLSSIPYKNILDKKVETEKVDMIERNKMNLISFDEKKQIKDLDMLRNRSHSLYKTKDKQKSFESAEMGNKTKHQNEPKVILFIKRNNLSFKIFISIF